MKTITKQAARKKAVGNVLASLRIEKLTPRDEVVSGMKACVAKKRTTTQVLQEVLQHHHVPLRRG
jgi:hypothetical protein